MTKFGIKFLCGVCVFPMALIAAESVAEEGKTSLLMDEIVVTSQKREQSLRDVSVTVTAFSGDQIQKLGFEGSADIGVQVPGLTVATVSGSPSIALFNIRGINQNDFADHHESPIAIYEDEAYIASLTAANFGLFDLQRVETLKGPQGIVFGRNATGGLIHFITKKPTTDEVNGYAKLKVGSFNQVRVEGAVNLPLGDNTAIRLSGMRGKHDGYLKNRIGTDAHEQDLSALRAQLLFTPQENIEVIFKAHYAQNDNESTGAYSELVSAPTGPNGTGELVGPNENPWGTCNGCDVFGYKPPSDDPLDGERDYEGFLDREVYGAGLHVSWDLDSFTVVSVSDYRKSKKNYAEDAEGSPNPLLNFATAADVETFSQELRANGETDNMRWLLGANYLKINGDYGSKIWDSSNFTGITGTADGLSFNTYSLWSQNKEAVSAFGQIEYDIADKLTAIAGIRYTRDKVDHSWRNTVVLDPFGFFALPGAVTQFDAKSTDNLFDFKAVLEYRPDDNWMLYGGVSQGSKGAGFSGQYQPDFAAAIPFGREKLIDYEVGAKGYLFDGAAFLNGSFFYYDYKDYQAFVFDGLAQRVANIPATIIGGEVELKASPMDGLDLSMGVSVLFEAKAKDVLMPDGVLKDQKMPMAPDFTLNGIARYSWDVPFGLASIQVDGAYQDKVNFAVINHPSTIGESYVVMNARISIAGEDDRWEVAGFVRNFTNKRYKTYALDVSSFSFVQAQFGRPRWWGAEVNVNF
tara:strand:- start:1732 stop:3972 length:2241 start_codon:yes stop_codon:yes gene_type:complete